MTITLETAGDLAARIEDRTASIVTMGLGFVGLPMALAVQAAGYRSVGFDVNPARVTDINSGKRLISYLGEHEVADAVQAGLRATDDPSALGEADIVLICVPTPLTEAQTPDLSFLVKAGQTLAARLRKGQMIVLESTTWPGAAATVLRPILEQSGLVVGQDIFLAVSPEREDPGNTQYSTATIPKIVGADDPASRQLAHAFYASIITQAVPVSSTATAEAVKLVENTFRNVNIALVNELKEALGEMGVDIWEVVRAAATKPFGYMPFYPGPGIGGDCIPVSPLYLSWRSRDCGAQTALVDLAADLNRMMPERIIRRLSGELEARSGKGLETCRILIIGIAYKPDVEDTRRSPALVLLDLLEESGAQVAYHDPYFPTFPLTRDHPHLAGRQSTPVSRETLEGFDAVLVATDHAGLDYAGLAGAARLIFDTRNAFAKRGIAVDPDRLIKV